MLDFISSDVIALIVQCLLVKEILQLCRIDRRRHLINQSPSWAAAAWQYSYLHINCADFYLPYWMIRDRDCINDHIPMSVWQPATRVLAHMLPRWLSIENRWKDKDMAFMQKLLGLIDHPTTETITHEGVSYEVLTNLTMSELCSFKSWNDNDFADQWKYKGSAQNLDSSRPRFILTATPYLQHLSLGWDYYEMKDVYDPEDIFAFVPHLSSLVFTQDDSEHTESGSSILPIRRTLECLPQLKHLALRELYLSVQDMIDIAAHPSLKVIRLESCASDDGLNSSDNDYRDIERWRDQFAYWSPGGRGFMFPGLSVGDGYDYRSNDDGELDDASDDEQEQEHGHSQLGLSDLAPRSVDTLGSQEQTYTAAQEQADIKFIKASIARPTTSASLRARLPLVNKLQAALKPDCCLTRRAHVLRYQLYLIHAAIAEALTAESDSSDTTIGSPMSMLMKKRKRISQ